MLDLAVAYSSGAECEQAICLATQLELPLDNNAKNQLMVSSNGLKLIVPPFLPMQADFNDETWLKRRNEGKKQGLVRACKPQQGLTILDATAGWGRDAAILASFGATVHMLERNPVMAALLHDALQRRASPLLNLSMTTQDAKTYLEALSPTDYPDVIYLDPMHPQRQKSSLVKKDMQVLQQLIGADIDARVLLEIARRRVKQRVVVKWPQNQPALEKAATSIEGKTIRFDIYLPFSFSIC